MNRNPILLLLLLVLLSACGQKGPLYLPDETTAQGAQSLPVPSSDEDQD